VESIIRVRECIRGGNAQGKTLVMLWRLPQSSVAFEQISHLLGDRYDLLESVARIP
jgi:hypothetical protein